MHKELHFNVREITDNAWRGRLRVCSQLSSQVAHGTPEIDAATRTPKWAVDKAEVCVSVRAL